MAVFESRNRNFDLTLTKELNLLWPPIHFKMYLIIQTKWCVMFLQYPRDLWLLMDFWSTCFKFEITWSRSSLLASLCTNFPTNSDSYVIGPKNLKWIFSLRTSRHSWADTDTSLCPMQGQRQETEIDPRICKILQTFFNRII